jgi:multiple antibiotic resistance protein
MSVNDVVRAAVALFAVVDPVGNLLIYEQVTRDLGAHGRIMVAAVSNLAAFALLALFILTGTDVLTYLHISLPSFEIAAGVLLVPTAFRLVEYGEPFNVATSGELASPLQRAIVPLGVPLLAGPGALATAVSVASTLGPAVTIAGAALVLAASTALFAAGGVIVRRLGAASLHVLSRLVGILLMAIAMNFIIDGLATILR